MLPPLKPVIADDFFHILFCLPGAVVRTISERYHRYDPRRCRNMQQIFDRIFSKCTDVVDSGENSYLDVTVDTLGINFDSRNSRMPVGFNIQTNGNVGRYQGYAEISYYVETQFALLVVNTTRATTGTVDMLPL